MLNVPVSSFLAVVSFLFGVAAVASLLSHLQVVEWRVTKGRCGRRACAGCLRVILQRYCSTLRLRTHTGDPTTADVVVLQGTLVKVETSDRKMLTAPQTNVNL